MFESRISAGATEKLHDSQKNGANVTSWSYDMEGHAKKCVEWYFELANKTNEHCYKTSTPCLDDHHSKKKEEGTVGEVSTVCCPIVRTCQYVARIGRHGIPLVCKRIGTSSHKMDKSL